MSIRDEAIASAGRAIREEVVRQLREEEQAKCQAGTDFYEEHVGPYLAATAAFDAIMERLSRPDEAMLKAGMRGHVRYSGGDSAVDREAAGNLWQAMLSMITPTAITVENTPEDRRWAMTLDWQITPTKAEREGE